MRTIRALEEIANTRGFDIALMTTFNLDVDFFERYIAGTLYGNDVKKIALFVDAKELNKAINATWKKSLLMGSRYSVNPVRIDGAFHPKVILLLGQEKAKLFVGSANFTQSGYSTNNEIFNTFEVTEYNTEYLSIIKSAVSFFRKIYEMSYGLDEEIMRSIEELPILQLKSNDNSELYLLDNTERSILEQLKEMIQFAEVVDIAVPFYDNDLNAVSGVAESLASSCVNAYVQNRRSRFNIKRSSHIERLTVIPFDSFINPKSSSFYHGKVIRFVSQGDSWILYGSANCTGAALLSSTKEGGNVECCVLEKGTETEFDYFYDNLVFEKPDADIVCDLLDFTSDQKTEKYYFKYGLAKDTNAELHVGTTGTFKEPVIFLGDVELECSYQPETRELLIEADADIFPKDSDIFTISIDDGESTCKIKCWFSRPQVIEMHRESERGFREFKFDPESVGDEYYEDLLNIMQILAIYTEDKIKRNETIRIVEKSREIEEDFEDAPEGIIDYVIPPRAPTLEEHKEYQLIKKAQKIGHDFVVAYTQPRGHRGKRSGTSRTQNGHRVLREATSTEQRIKRAIRSAVSEMLKEDNIKQNTVEDYLQHACIILDTMSNLTDTVVKGMFDLNLNSQMRMDLLRGLVKLEDKYTDLHISAILQMIIELHYINQRRLKSIASYDETDIIEIIKELNRKNDIREGIAIFITDESVGAIGDHLEELFFSEDDIGKVSGIRPSRIEALRYIEKLFGYKTKVQLEDLLRKNFGENCSIQIDDAYKVASNVKLKDYFNGNNIEWIINEIEKYCKNYNISIKSIEIDLHGINIPDTVNPAVRLVYKRIVGKKTIERCEYHKYGEPYYERLSM